MRLFARNGSIFFQASIIRPAIYVTPTAVAQFLKIVTFFFENCSLEQLLIFQSFFLIHCGKG